MESGSYRDPGSAGIIGSGWVGGWVGGSGKEEIPAEVCGTKGGEWEGGASEQTAFMTSSHLWHQAGGRFLRGWGVGTQVFNPHTHMHNHLDSLLDLNSALSQFWCLLIFCCLSLLMTWRPVDHLRSEF